MKSATARTARVPAFAKINLGLRVLYKRPDTYHELRTVFQTITLADRIDISFAPARRTRVEITGTQHIAENLAGKAAELILQATSIQGDIRIHLNKNIPMGAGLGGGSTDAAAVLLALPVLAGKNASPEALAAAAATLGSDVPFFLNGGTALGLGRGEELYPLPFAPARGLLIAPEVHSSTAEAYRDLSVTLVSTLTSIALQNKLSSFQRELWQRGRTAGGLSIDSNDFEPFVFARHPQLEKIKRRLLRLGAQPAAMSGSGSAVFGVFNDAVRLERAKKSFPEAKVFEISFVSRARYQAAWRRALKPHTDDDSTSWPPRSLYAR